VKVRNAVLRGEVAGQILPTKPKEKAAAVFGRLYALYCGDRPEGVRKRWPHRRSVDALALETAAVTLSVRLAVSLDAAAISDTRFTDTQIGKVIFRRAGGWTRRTERIDTSKTEYLLQADGTLRKGPAVYAVELNRYAISRGPTLAVIGRRLQDATDALWDANGGALVAKARKLKTPPVQKRRWSGKPDRKSETQNAFKRPHDKIRKITRPL
jgi:hypothetical protein